MGGRRHSRWAGVNMVLGGSEAGLVQMSLSLPCQYRVLCHPVLRLLSRLKSKNKHKNRDSHKSQATLSAS